MRVPLNKPYRAFSELDRFSDQECCLFIVAARRHHRVSGALVYLLLVPAAVLALPLVFAALVGLDAAVDVVGMGDAAAMATLAVVVVLVIGSLCLTWMAIRDRWLRRIVREQLRGASCYGCNYSLLGLPVVDNVIICPECGQPFDLREGPCAGRPARPAWPGRGHEFVPLTLTPPPVILQKQQGPRNRGAPSCPWLPTRAKPDSRPHRLAAAAHCSPDSFPRGPGILQQCRGSSANAE